MRIKLLGLLSLLFLGLTVISTGCEKDPEPPTPLDPDTAPKTSIDRFSEDAGTLMVRTESNGLPEANEPINFDSGAPFITKGYGPDGSVVEYYNFDVQSTNSAPIYLFVDEDGDSVEDQLNVVNVVPGDAGYNDFWRVYRVTVPDDYVANTITSLEDINDSGYTIEETNTVVNCPIVPDNSTASKRYSSEEDPGLIRGWYKDEVIYYFSFFEKILDGGDSGTVPLSPIYVMFNINPDSTNPDSGPASGFNSESDSDQTHNVLQTLPEDDAYSPLWLVNVLDNNDFESVSDLESAQSATLLASGVATVNCPVVSQE